MYMYLLNSYSMLSKNSKPGNGVTHILVFCMAISQYRLLFMCLNQLVSQVIEREGKTTEVSQKGITVSNYHLLVVHIFHLKDKYTSSK